MKHFFLSRRFLPIFVTQFLGAFSDNAFKTAIAILITYAIARDSDNAAILVTISSGLFILPFFLFSALAGQLADKYDKAKLTRLYKLIELFIMAAGVVALFTAHTWFLLILLFAMGTQSTFFGPIKYSILPQQLHPQELMQGNAYIEGSTFVAALIGTVTGGATILLNNGEVIVGSILTASALIGYLASRFILTAPGGSPDLVINRNIPAESCHILKLVLINKTLRLYLLLISWFWLVGSIFLAQTVLFTKEVLYADETVVTLCLTIFSTAIAVGSIFCTRISKGNASLKYVPVAAMGMAVSIIALVIYSNLVSVEPEELYNIVAFLKTPSHWVILLTLFFIAFFGGIYTVPLYTLMQREADKSQLSRTIAVNNIINSFFMVSAVVIVIAIYETGGTVSHVFSIVAAITAGIGIFIGFRNKKHG